MASKSPDELIADARGQMIVGWGTEVEARGGNRDLGAVTSEHERLHVSLTRSTSFGVLLRACATHRPGALQTLVVACRRTQEVYATCLSAWMIAQVPETTLAPYPGYMEYVETGRRFARPFTDASLAARAAVSAACQVAMQPPMSRDIRQMLTDPDAPIRLPDEAQPDFRLARLLEGRIDMRALVQGYPVVWSDQPVWALDGHLESSERRPFGEIVRTIGYELTRAMYGAFQDHLLGLGVPCLAWDEQGIDPEVTAIGELGAQEWLEEPRGIDVPGTASADTRLKTLHTFDSERWIQQDAEGRLYAEHVVHALRESTPGGLTADHLVTRRHGIGHAFVIARPLSLLLEQYAMTSETRDLLTAAARDGVVTAVRATVQEPTMGRLTVLGVLTTHEELSLLEALNLQDGIAASISHSVLTMPGWADYWVPVLHSASEITLNCDIPLTRWLTVAEGERVPPRLRFYCFSPTGSNHDTPTQVLAVEYEGAEGKVDRRVLFLGGPVSLSLLASMVSESSSLHAIEDPEILGKSPELMLAVSRLLADEPWFDRRGFTYLARFREDKARDTRA
jgi:hypothetical protein